MVVATRAVDVDFKTQAGVIAADLGVPSEWPELTHGTIASHGAARAGAFCVEGAVVETIGHLEYVRIIGPLEGDPLTLGGNHEYRCHGGLARPQPPS